MTVNHTIINRGELILLSKYIPLDGHGGHLQTPMYGNVLCAPDATRRTAIQRPATQQPANRRPATQRPTTSNSQPRVPRPEGGRRPESKCQRQVTTQLESRSGPRGKSPEGWNIQGQRADRAFGQVAEKRRQLIITRRMVIFRFVPTTGPTAFMIKRAGKFDKKVMSKKAFPDS